MTFSVFPHFSWPWYFWRMLARYFVECPSFGVCLMFLSWLDWRQVWEEYHWASLPFLQHFRDTKISTCLITGPGFLIYNLILLYIKLWQLFWLNLYSFGFPFFPLVPLYTSVPTPNPYSVESSSLMWIFLKVFALLIHVHFILEGEANINQGKRGCVSFYYHQGDKI